MNRPYLAGFDRPMTEVAHLLHAVLNQLGLQSFPKVSDSKGVQLYVPLNGAVTYNATTPLGKAMAELLAQQHPAFFAPGRTMRSERTAGQENQAL